MSASTEGRPRTISRTTSRRSKALPPYRYPSTAMITLGSICRKRSSTPWAPMSGAALDHTAPMLFVASMAMTDIEACDAAAELHRGMVIRGRTIREEIVPPVIYGLLGDSHAWKSAGSTPEQNVMLSRQI